MQEASHPSKYYKISVPEYIKEFGNDPVSQNDMARCPTCKQRLNIVARSTTGSHSHFAHLPKSGFCPTKKYSEAPYAGLPPQNPNAETARQIKLAFIKNWQRHFNKLNYFVKALHIDEFKTIVRRANQERIWEYASLEEFHLPYIFATLTDFPQKNSYKKNGEYQRIYWFRCWFDSTVKRYDDLWIDRPTPLIFWRGWYNLPKNKKRPGADDLIDSLSEELSPDFLYRDVYINYYITDKLNDWIWETINID